MWGPVFIAAGMVNENWLKVAVSAMALGIGVYLVPLCMVANPDLIALEQVPGKALIAAAKTGLSLSVIAYGVIAPLAVWARLLLVGCGRLLLLS